MIHIPDCAINGFYTSDFSFKEFEYLNNIMRENDS
jgi:hypothetical protein